MTLKLEGEEQDEKSQLEQLQHLWHVTGVKDIAPEINGEMVTIETQVFLETEIIDGETSKTSRNIYAHCQETDDVYYFGEETFPRKCRGEITMKLPSVYDVGVHLPPRIEEDVFCKMEEDQANLYEDELSRIQSIFAGSETDDQLRKNSFVILQGLMRLCLQPIYEYARDHPQEVG